jgi:hypothetical protein
MSDDELDESEEEDGTIAEDDCCEVAFSPGPQLTKLLFTAILSGALVLAWPHLVRGWFAWRTQCTLFGYNLADRLHGRDAAPPASAARVAVWSYYVSPSIEQTSDYEHRADY